MIKLTKDNYIDLVNEVDMYYAFYKGKLLLLVYDMQEGWVWIKASKFDNPLYKSPHIDWAIEEALSKFDAVYRIHSDKDLYSMIIQHMKELGED